MVCNAVQFDALQIRVAVFLERLVPICTASRPKLLSLDTHHSEKLTSHKNLLCFVLDHLLLAASSVKALLLVTSVEITVSLCSQWQWGSVLRVLRSSTSLLFLSAYIVICQL